jgi:hypothetical protein
LRRRMAVAADGLVAVSHWARYVVELWTVDGQHRSTVFRNPDWFVREVSDAPGPRSVQEAPRIDADGRLWTVSHVPDPQWRESTSTIRDLRGGRTPGVSEGDLDGYLDSVVEVIDPNTGQLIASSRVDPRLTFVSNSGYAASYREGRTWQPVHRSMEAGVGAQLGFGKPRPAGHCLTRLPRVTGAELVQALERAACVVKRVKGSYQFLTYDRCRNGRRQGRLTGLPQVVTSE